LNIELFKHMNCFCRIIHRHPRNGISFVGVLAPYYGPVQYLEEEELKEGERKGDRGGGGGEGGEEGGGGVLWYEGCTHFGGVL